jgi:iron(II)-dependent oxidoreductase
MTLDGMRFCVVPAGPFRMGADDISDDERPLREVDLPSPYALAQFPVSVAQWRESLRERGIAAGDADSLRDPDNHPVRVGWHEAIAFCEWLTARGRDRLPPGWIVTLPSEAEWEKAARGGLHLPSATLLVTLDKLQSALATAASLALANPAPDRSHPWPSSAAELAEAANTAESGYGETTPLGAFALGAAPYGHEEMAGNLCEWTRSLWGQDPSTPDWRYPYDPANPKREDLKASDAVLRLVRGGSFDDDAGGARCAYRYWAQPSEIYYDLGFRVVLRSAPVLSKPGPRKLRTR